MSLRTSRAMRAFPTVVLMLGLGAVALAPTNVAAQMYGSLRLGPAKVQDLNYRNTATVDLLLDVETGWQLQGAVGYRFSPMFRAEINVGYLDADAEGTFRQNIITIAACGITPQQPCLAADVEGDIKGTTVLGMGYVDIPTGGAVTPFIGAGLGYGRESLDVVGRALTATGPGTPFTIMDDGDGGFVYRAAAGLSLDLGGVTGDVAYSYTQTEKPNLNGRGALVAFTFDRPLKVHAVTASVRVSF